MYMSYDKLWNDDKSIDSDYHKDEEAGSDLIFGWNGERRNASQLRLAE